MVRPQGQTARERFNNLAEKWQSKGTHPNQPVLGLELLLRSLIVVDQAKACAPSTTEDRPETEGDDAVLLGLVDSREAL